MGEMEKRGQSLYGGSYAIRPIDRPVLVKVLCYFLQDEAMAAMQEINLQKGLMLCGPVGCGKTSAMHIIRSLMPNGEAFGIVSCRNIVTRFNQDGFGIIDRYSACPRPGTLMRSTYCFDDMGLEQTGNFYQNECNVVAEILFNRYEAFVQDHVVTHVTTNLSISELEACYGNRLRSRMREMLNLVAFDAASPDKRH
jgi:energy-coupling factor transporter ATP-binding protein EcfA2